MKNVFKVLVALFGIISFFGVLGFLYSMTPNQGGIEGCEKSTRVNILKGCGFVVSNSNFKISGVKRYLLDSSHVDMNSFENKLVDLGYPHFESNFSVDIKCGLLPDFYSMNGVGCVKGDVFWIYDKSKNLVEVVILY